MPVKDPCKLLQRLLVEPREGGWIEFKHNDDNPEEIGQYVSALANSAMIADRDHAYLLFGVEDATREPIGTTVRLEDKKKGNEPILNWLTRLLEPRLFIEARDFTCDEKQFSVLVIDPTYTMPVKFAGTAYIRIGEQKKKLHNFPEHERALWIATARRRFEDAVALTNVSPATVLELLDCDSYYKLTEEPRADVPDEHLRKLCGIGAIKPTMEGDYDILNLGAILFAKNVADFPSIKRKTTRVIKYSGIDKRKSEREHEGVFGYALGFQGLIKYVMANSQEEIYVEGVRRRAPICPEVAVREVIANALIHQDFTKDGAGPVVEIYSDRIEVTNPGNSLIETDRMIDERRSRNEALAGAMRTLNLCEERGGGLDKSIIAIEEASLPAPQFVPSSDSMRVILFGHRPLKKMSKQEKQRACFFHCIIKWMAQDYMSNSSLRKRMSIADEEYQVVSAIISDAIKAKRIIPAEPDQGRKTARYIPYWAK